MTDNNVKERNYPIMTLCHFYIGGGGNILIWKWNLTVTSVIRLDESVGFFIDQNFEFYYSCALHKLVRDYLLNGGK